MGHGIGPQSLGAAGQNPKSKPCGTPLDFNEKLRAALPEIKEKNPGFAAAIEADSGANYGTPLPMMDMETMSGATMRKRQLANIRGMADPAIGNTGVAGPGPTSPGGGSAGIQSDLEGLQTKLADLKSQIDNLAKTV